jgi:CRISPR/Cas system-associated endonuclease Cas3-HD
MYDPWITLGMRVFQLGLEAQSVMALRMMRLASGDSRGQDELNRMVVEKMTALAEAQIAAATAIMNGHKDHVVARKALSVFRKHVRDNRRRLSPERSQHFG